MKKFNDILAEADILEEDKALFQKVLAKQDQNLAEKVMVEVQNDPEMLKIMVDLVKLKLVADNNLNKSYLTGILSRKITAVIG